MLERVAYISDQRFFHCDKEWFTTASFPLAYVSRELKLREWTFWGRLYEIDEPGNLFRLDTPPGIDVRFKGPWAQRRGFFGYLRSAFTQALELRRVVRDADLVWLKLPFVFSLLAWPHCRPGQIVVTHVVGDPSAAMGARSAALAPAGKIMGWASAHLSARADLAVFVSKHLARRYGSSRSDAIVANESRVSVAMLASGPLPRAEGSLRLIFVGRLSPEKRLDDLLEALSLHRDPVLSVAGDGPERERLERLAARLGVAKRVTWLGYVPWGASLFELLRHHDILVLPSATEGLPLVLIEAMSQGVPVIATRVGGIAELVEHGENGLLVPPRAPDRLSEELARVASDPSLLARLARGALATAMKHSVERQLGPLLQKVAELAHERRV